MTADELARVKALHARLVAQSEWTRPDPEIRAGITVGLDAQSLGEAIAELEDRTSLAAEVALGVTHWTGCSAEAPCCRCTMEALMGQLDTLRAAHSGLVRDRTDLAHEMHQAMLLKLAANAHKGHWRSLRREQLLALLDGELAELEAAMDAGECPEAVLLEGADVANFVAMLCDNYRREWTRADAEASGERCGDGTPVDPLSPYPAGE